MENVNRLILLVEFGICVGTKLYGKVISETTTLSFLTIHMAVLLTKLYYPTTNQS